MKKVYALLLLITLIHGTGSAQSFSVSNANISGDPAFLLQGHATINNNSASAKDVAVLRTVNNLYPGHIGFFCWFQCYPPNISNSPDYINIPSGGNINLFQADVETSGINGVSYNTYCFYDINNPSDSACVDFVFDATTGISEAVGNRNYISKPYPNPSSENASFYISTLKGVKARLKLFNMLGTEVKDVAIADNNKSSVKINVSDLKSGVYFYSLFVNGKSAYTGKMLVNGN